MAAILLEPTPAAIEVLSKIDATNDASQANGRINSLFGTSADWRDALPTEVVQHVKSLSNEELFPMGEAALRDIADNLVILAEIRDRFHYAKGSLMGYANWKEFVAKNSAYSIRTIQRRLNEATGTKDETKINDRYKAPAIEVPHKVSAPVDIPVPDIPAKDARQDARQAWNNLSPEEQAQWGVKKSDKSDGWDVEPYTHYRLVNWERRHDHSESVPPTPDFTNIPTKPPELAPILTDKPTLEELSEIIKFIADDIGCGHQLHELSDRLVSIADDIDRIVLLDIRISNADPQRYDRDVSTLIKGLVRDRRNEQEMKDALARGETHYNGKKIMGSRNAPYIQRWTRAECKNRLAEAYNPVEPKPTAGAQ